MRLKLLIAGGAIMATCTAACNHPATQQLKAVPSPVASSQKGEAPVLADGGNVCVLLTLAPGLYLPHLPRHALTPALVGEMMRLHAARGHSLRMGDNPDEPLFVAGSLGTSPRCGDSPTDIHVSASYTTLPDGSPFRFSYTIRQGGKVRSGSEERNIREEIASGRLRYPRKTGAESAAWGDDLRMRAAQILNEISP